MGSTPIVASLSSWATGPGPDPAPRDGVYSGPGASPSRRPQAPQIQTHPLVKSRGWATRLPGSAESIWISPRSHLTSGERQSPWGQTEGLGMVSTLRP